MGSDRAREPNHPNLSTSFRSAESGSGSECGFGNGCQIEYGTRAYIYSLPLVLGDYECKTFFDNVRNHGKLACLSEPPVFGAWRLLLIKPESFVNKIDNGPFWQL